MVYTTDNGAEAVTWPDGGATPFKGEKATNWEGGFRVPCLIRWPDVIKPGTIVNDICAHEDFIPTFAAAAGDPNVVDKALKGTTLNGKNFKVHLDGMNLLPFLKGEAKESPRSDFFYWSDDGDLMAIRYRDWKVAFLEQNTEISPKTPMGVWTGQFTTLRTPKITICAPTRSSAGPKASTMPTGSCIARSSLARPQGPMVAKRLESFRDVSAARQGRELYGQ